MPLGARGPVLQTTLLIRGKMASGSISPETIGKHESGKAACKYGNDCFRTNPQHLEQFWHPKKGKRKGENQVKVSYYQYHIHMNYESCKQKQKTTQSCQVVTLLINNWQ